MFVFCLHVYDYNCTAFCFNDLALPFALLCFARGSPENEDRAVRELFKCTGSALATSLKYGLKAKREGSIADTVIDEYKNVVMN